MVKANPTGCCGVKIDCCPNPVPTRLHVDATDSSCGNGAGGTMVWDGTHYWIGDVDFECDTDPMQQGQCEKKTLKLRLACEDPGAGIVLVLEYSTDGGQTWAQISHDGGCAPEMNLTASGIFTEIGCESTTDFTITE